MYVRVCLRIYTRGVHQKAKSHIDISENIPVEYLSDAAWVCSAAGGSLAPAQDSCCEDIDVWSQGVML